MVMRFGFRARCMCHYSNCIYDPYFNESNSKISEIAEKLKYNTPANFIRYFRKLEGTTPGQYRDRFLQK